MPLPGKKEKANRSDEKNQAKEPEGSRDQQVGRLNYKRSADYEANEKLDVMETLRARKSEQEATGLRRYD